MRGLHSVSVMTYAAFAEHLADEVNRLVGEDLPGEQDASAWLVGLMAVIAAGRGPLAGMARRFIANAPPLP